MVRSEVRARKPHSTRQRRRAVKAAAKRVENRIETEFGLYYIHLHDKFPTVAFRGHELSIPACMAVPSAPGPGCDLGYFIEDAIA